MPALSPLLLQLDADTGAADATLTAGESDSWWTSDSNGGAADADTGGAGSQAAKADVQGIQAQLDALEAQLAGLEAADQGAEQVCALCCSLGGT